MSLRNSVQPLRLSSPFATQPRAERFEGFFFPSPPTTYSQPRDFMPSVFPTFKIPRGMVPSVSIANGG